MPATKLTADRLRGVFAGPIFAGHYHIPMRDQNVVSVGSLVQHGFGETQEPKGLWVWDTDTGDITLEPIEGPRFVTVSSKKEAEETAGCYVRVKTDTLAKAEKLKKVAEDSGAKGVVIVLDKKFTTAHATTVTLASPRDMLIEYLTEKPETSGRVGELMFLFDLICEEAPKNEDAVC